MKNGHVYEHKGRVSSTTGIVNATTGSISCKATFPNPDGQLYSGVQGSVVLPDEMKGVIVVPQIAVVRLPHLSNYTDFAPLESDGAVNLIYTDSAQDLDKADLIILPGSKNTGGDLRWLRNCGLDTVLKRLAKKGTRILGICGGYQMLGENQSSQKTGKKCLVWAFFL